MQISIHHRCLWMALCLVCLQVSLQAQRAYAQEEPRPSSIIVDSGPVIGEVGKEECFTATVIDQFGHSLAGAEIRISVDRVFIEQIISDENGEVEYCYTPTEAREVIIRFSHHQSETGFVFILFPDPDAIEVVSFNLVDAETDKVFRTIQDNDTIKLSSLPGLTRKLSIQAITDPEETGSVYMRLVKSVIRPDGITFTGLSHEHVENYMPYALYGDIAGDYSGRIFPPTSYGLTAIAYSEKNGQGRTSPQLFISFTIINDLPPTDDFAVTGFDLYDAFTDDKIMELTEGTVVSLSELAHNDLTVFIKTDPYFVGSLQVKLTGPVSVERKENFKPYTVFRNHENNFFGQPFMPGNYTLTVTPYSEVLARGQRGTPLEVNFTVVENTETLARNINVMKKGEAQGIYQLTYESIAGYIAYPIPFDDHFFLKTPAEAGKLDVVLYDINGKMYAVKVSEDEALKVDTELPSGIYFLRVSSENRLIKTLKISKK